MKKSRAHVLVVEDNQDIADLTRAALRHVHIEASIAITGEAALMRLATESYDLILLDIVLTGMNGLEVCRRLKADERLKHIPVIFLSGQTSRHYKDEACRLGAVDFIEKPFTVAELLTRVTGRLKLGTNDLTTALPDVVVPIH